MTSSTTGPEPWWHTAVAHRPAPESIVNDLASVLETLVELEIDTVCIAPGSIPDQAMSRLVADVQAKGLRLFTGCSDSKPTLCALDSSEWNASTIVTQIANHEAALPEDAWPAWELERADRTPLADWLGLAQAQNALLLLLTLRGTPIFRDLPGNGPAFDLYRRLRALRLAEPALVAGSMERIWHEESILAWIRSDGSHRFLIAINVATAPGTLFMGDGERGEVVLGTDERRSRLRIGEQLDLAPEEGVIVRLAPAPTPQS